MTRGADATLPRLVEAFFREHLERVRGASPHTVRAYRDTLQLFFRFLADSARRPVAALCLDDLSVERVLAFLEHLETRRRNSAATRNCRLAALHGFFHHLLRHDPTRAAQYHRVLAVPTKKARRSLPAYLEPEEVRAILAHAHPDTPTALRDHTLLLFLYNTGARISEALAVCPQDLEFGRRATVRLHGKGSKDRRCPLWRETAAALARLPTVCGPAEPIFRSARGTPLTRDGVAHRLALYVERASHTLPDLRRRRVTPHVLRHSCAVALLQAGVDVTVIRDYLGHASIATTSRSLATNLQMKRTALDAFWRRAGLAPTRATPWRPSSDLLAFLATL
jgi:site-specific recombinase XerD